MLHAPSKKFKTLQKQNSSERTDAIIFFYKT